MGIFYEKLRKLYYFLSPQARKQVKIERMVAECIDMQNKTRVLLETIEESTTQVKACVDESTAQLKSCVKDYGSNIDHVKECCLKNSEEIKAHTQIFKATKEIINENTKIIQECKGDIEKYFHCDKHDKFTGHYELWRLRRINCIVNHYGDDWFKGKNILELGAGYGDIGYFFSTLGAEVTFVEGRREHCDIIRRRYPQSKVYEMNCENEWAFSENVHFDLVLHMGLLYHLDNFLFVLDHCLKCADNLVLETEVCDSDDENFILKIQENAQGWDQSLIGAGTRPSAGYIEEHLRKMGWSYERVNDTSCNASFHKYDWNVTNTMTWQNGMRRLWFCSLTN